MRAGLSLCLLSCPQSLVQELAHSRCSGNMGNLPETNRTLVKYRGIMPSHKELSYWTRQVAGVAGSLFANRSLKRQVSRVRIQTSVFWTSKGLLVLPCGMDTYCGPSARKGACLRKNKQINKHK